MAGGRRYTPKGKVEMKKKICQYLPTMYNIIAHSYPVPLCVSFDFILRGSQCCYHSYLTHRVTEVSEVKWLPRVTVSRWWSRSTNPESWDLFS